MRSAFITTLLECAARDERIFLLTGDLGYGVLEPFVQRFPQRYLNVGVAEQNLIGIAAGLTLEGYTPVAYSIATFAAFRAFEFWRNDVCFQRLNVKLVGVGAGLCYPQYAITHQSIDDVAVMRCLPNLTLLNPGDPAEAAGAVRAMLAYDGPVYLRIGAKGEPAVHAGSVGLTIGRGITVCPGADVTLLATGAILAEAAQAVEVLAQQGVAARLISLPTVTPLDTALVRRAAIETPALVTVEEALVAGGLGSAVAEVLARPDVPKVPLLRLGIPNHYPSEIGSQRYLRQRYGLSGSQIAASVQDLLARR